jgi:Tol biopolymer transport system component
MLKRFCLFILICLPFSLSAQAMFQVLGKAERLIASDEQNYTQPVWSADGSKIAYTGDNYRGLWVINSDGTSPLKLSDEAGAGFDFQWSADSREILTRVSRFDSGRRLNAIKSFNVDTRTEKILREFTQQKLGLPRWTPDNSQVYFYNGSSIELVNTGKRLKIFAEQPLFFLKYGHIYSLGSARDMINAPDVIVNGECLNLRVSPDGKKISYELLGGNLFVVNTDGSNRTDLGKGYNARWAPDSNHLIFMITEDDGHTFLSSDLFISDINGNNKVNLTNTTDKLEMNPCWDPQGEKIVYDDYLDGAIYLLNLMQ